MMQIQKQANPKLLGGIFALVGLGLLGGAGYAGQNRLKILNDWPTADAEVVRSEVTRKSDSDSTTYGVEIQFRYTVNGKEYTSASTMGYTTSSYTQMRRAADEHPPGSHHQIRYDPQYPPDIYFNAGYNFGFFFVPLLLGGMGLIFTVVGLAVFSKARRTGEVRCPSCGQVALGGQKFCGSCAAPLPQTDERSGPPMPGA